MEANKYFIIIIIIINPRYISDHLRSDVEMKDFYGTSTWVNPAPPPVHFDPAVVPLLDDVQHVLQVDPVPLRVMLSFRGTMRLSVERRR